MEFRGISHLAIGCTDLDRSIHFYRDLLGASVVRDEADRPAIVSGGSLSDPARPRAHVVHIAWGTGPDAPFITLTKHPQALGDRAVPLNHIGVNHIAFWVDDFEATLERLNAAGVPVVMEPGRFKADAYPGSTGDVMSAMVADPDGTVIQLDHRL